MRTATYLTPMLTLLILQSCGKGELLNSSSQSDLRSKVKIGRSYVFSSAIDSAPLSLDSNMIHVMREPTTGALIKAEFDTSKSDTAFEFDQLLQASVDTVQDYRDELRVQTDEINLDTPTIKEISDNLTSVHFKRLINGREVRYAHLDIVFSKDQHDKWKLREISNNTFGAKEIATRSNQVERPLFESFNTTDLNQEFLFPATDKNGEIKLHEGRTFELKNDLGEHYIALQSLVTGEILEAYSPIISARSQLSTSAFERSYLEAPKSFQLPDVEVKIGGKTSKTNLKGEFDLAAPASANIRLYSKRVDLMKWAQTIHFNVQLKAGSNDLSIADATQKRALNAYLAIHRVNQFARKHLKESQTSFLNDQVDVSIDVPGSCNAFYTNGTINLFNEGENCANMANVNDVIYHEWGHGLDDYTGRQGGITDGAFSEGIGDILSSYMSGSPNLGTGFFLNKSEGIRQLQNNKKYPQDVTNEVHSDGLIIGGAFWDLRTMLIDRYGPIKGAYLAELYFFKHLLTADSYRESYQAVLRLDDDDGNPSTKSPNHCLITEAFAKHGLAATTANCLDQFDSEKGLSDVSLAILSNTNEGSTIAISTSKVGVVSICADSKEKCRSGKTPSVVATLDGLLNQKYGYLVNKFSRLDDEQIVTVLVKDDSGKDLGSKSFKIKKR